MMQQALRTRLLNNATVSGLVGTRVDWDARPQGKSLPAVTLAMVDIRDQHMGGPQVTRKTIIQADCWATKPIDAHTLAEAVIIELQPPATVDDTQFLGAFLTAPSMSEDTDNGMVFRVMVRGDLFHTPIP
jgi:hypothetical protein